MKIIMDAYQLSKYIETWAHIQEHQNVDTFEVTLLARGSADWLLIKSGTLDDDGFIPSV